VRRKTGCRDGANCPKCHACQWRRKPAQLPDERPTAEFEHTELVAPSVSAAQGASGFTPDVTELSEPIRRQLCVAVGPPGLELPGLELPGLELPGLAPPGLGPPGLEPSGLEPPANVMAESPFAGDHEGGGIPAPPQNSFECPSMGSIGHPEKCGLPCKYAGRLSGCKDGWHCTRCHLCRWQRKISGVGLPGVPSLESTSTKDEATIETSMGSIGHPTTCNRPCKYARRKGGCRDGWQCTSCHLCRWSRYATRAEMKEGGSDANEDPEEEDACEQPILCGDVQAP